MGPPRWSVLVPAYNCARFLQESLQGVLAQDRGVEAMQILVVDDHSDDDCEGVVNAIGRNRIEYVRQPQRVGLVANLNTCLAKARGELVHILHADDSVLPGFYASLEPLFSAERDIGAAFCRVVYRDERSGTESVGPLLQESEGPLSNPIERLLLGGAQTSSMVVRRDVYRALGGFDARFTCSCEDWEMWIRIATHHAVAYHPAALARYRFMRDGSLTALNRSNGRYAHDMALAHRVVESYVPRSHRQILRRARHCSAEWLLSQVVEPLSREGKRGPTLVNAWYALRCSARDRELRLAGRCVLNLLSSHRHPKEKFGLD